jgi:hypothetical protein
VAIVFFLSDRAARHRSEHFLNAGPIVAIQSEFVVDMDQTGHVFVAEVRERQGFHGIDPPARGVLPPL